MAFIGSANKKDKGMSSVLPSQAPPSSSGSMGGATNTGVTGGMGLNPMGIPPISSNPAGMPMPKPTVGMANPAPGMGMANPNQGFAGKGATTPGLSGGMGSGIGQMSPELQQQLLQIIMSSPSGI